MAKRNWLILSAAICGLTGISVASAHAGPHHFEKLDQNKDGVITTQEFEAQALTFFNEADANKDGKVTAEERKAHHERRMQEHFAERDDDGDGVLDRDEVGRMPDEMFTKLDTDKSGTLSPEELRTGFQAHKGKHKGPGHKGKGLDPNGDGVITKDEALQKARTHMQKLDENGDGKLTQDELKAAHPRHRHGPRGKAPQQ